MKKLMLLITLLVASSAFAGENSCSIRQPNSEVERALDDVHSSKADAAEVVARWLPKVAFLDERAESDWLHVAVDIGRKLVRLGRNDEARELFSLVARLDADGQWGKKAAAHLLEAKP